MMKILIIGGAGFIGSHVVDAFIEDGIFPQVLDRNFEKFREPLNGVNYILADFANRDEVEKAISQGVDVVLHLVSSTLPQLSNDHPIDDVQMNLVGSIALFELCAKYKVKKVVFLSSGGTIYGIPESLPINESHPNFPICSYGIVKLAIEKYLAFFHHNYGLEYCVLRISNPYGIRQDPFSMQGAVGVFAAKILRGEQITVWGDGTVLRDYVGVKDVARLCVAASKSDFTGIYNVGSSTGVTINRLIEIISCSLNVKPNVNFEPARTFDVPEIVLDCSRARAAFDWVPQVRLEDGVAEYVDWAKSIFGMEI